MDKGPLPHVEQDLDVGIVELFAHMVPGLHLLFLVVEGMVDGLRQDDKCLVAALLLLVELPAGVLYDSRFRKRRGCGNTEGRERERAGGNWSRAGGVIWEVIIFFKGAD